MEESKRPWGEYDVVSKTKIIRIKPGQRLSVQYHHHRDEYWTITRGSGRVLIARNFASSDMVGKEDSELAKFLGDEWRETKVGDSYQILRGVVHSVEAGSEGIEFVEIATGLVDEDDIVRLEDRYGRAKPS